MQTHQLFLELKKYLTPYTEEFEIESKLFICHFLNWESNTFVSHLTEEIPEKLYKKIKSAVKTRVLENIPLAYIFKKWPFRKNIYATMPGVLIPRADTEHLVEKAIELIRQKNITAIYEIRYGSGIISIEIAKEFPNCTIIGWDISKDAFKLANTNLKKLILNKIDKLHPSLSNTIIPKFFQTDFFKICDDYPFNFSNTLFISNPPYIKTDTIKTLAPQVILWEPIEALDGGESGIEFYKKFLSWHSDKSNQGSNTKGYILFEIGYDQQKQMEKLSETYNLTLSITKDLQNHPRVCLFSN